MRPDRNKRLRMRRALAGQCLDCHRRAAPGRSRCTQHLAAHARWSRDYTARQR